MRNPKTIHYVDALAGSGKTYQAIRWALTEAITNHRKTVIVFKSTQLIQQALSDTKAVIRNKPFDVKITALHSDIDGYSQHEHSVSGLILDHLKRADKSAGEVLMITEAAFLNMQHWPNRYAWTCICDEIFSIAPTTKINLPDTHALLTAHFKLDAETTPYGAVELDASGKAALTKIAENTNRDDVYRLLSPLAKHLLNPSYQTYMGRSQYEAVVNNSGMADRRQIEIFSLLQPTIFGSGETRVMNTAGAHSETVTDYFADIIVMGANFKDSLMALLWPAMGVEIVAHEAISKGLRYRTHNCGKRLQIEYLFEANWSKSFAGKTSRYNGSELANLDILLDVVGGAFDGDAFAYLCNKSTNHEALKSNGGHHLPNSPWGHNIYQHMHNVAIFSAINPTPAHLAFLKHIGIEGDAVRKALYHDLVYQAVMRCSLRDLKADAPVHVIVPDRKTAAALSQLFPACSTAQMAVDLKETARKESGRPAIGATKPKAQSLRETRQRTRAMKKEVYRIKSGGAVDYDLLEQFRRGCRADNKTLGELQNLCRG